jgi:MFS family permease
VLAFACALSMITYLDRVCFGSAMTDIVRDLGLDSVADLGLAVTAFAFSYAVFEVPSGWLGDVYGPRKTLIRIVLWWSLFTALTGMVGLWYFGALTKLPYIGMSLSLFLMVVVRFLFGMGEAGAYPNITRALHNWFPFGERGFTQGMVWMSGRLMGGLTPIIWGLLVAGLATTTSLRTSDTAALQAGDTITIKEGREVTQADGSKAIAKAGAKFKLAKDVSAGSGAAIPLADGASLELDEGDKFTRLYFPALLPNWRWAFWLFGILGVFWCVFFALWFRNRPEEKPSVNQAELALIQAGGGSSHAAHSGVPWLKLMTSGNLWILCLMYFCAAYGWYFNITYLPAFLEQQHDVESTSLVGMVYKGGPLLLGAAGCLGGGFFTDWFIRRTGNRRLGRRIMGLFGHGLCAACMFACFVTPTAFTFFLAISFAAFFNDLTMGSAWSTCQDIGRKYAAIVAGCMNTIGNLGGAMAGYITGRVLNSYLAAHADKLGTAVESLSAAEKAAGMLPGYQISFVTFGAVYVLATFCWLMIDSTKPVAPEAEDKH